MRLVTRSDFDGLVCGALLKHLNIIDTWTFVHPKDVQDGKVEVSKDDVLANIPYVEGCGMWFDHHATEVDRIGKDLSVPGECRLAPSCARVVYDYYGGTDKMPHFASLVESCDKVDSGQMSAEEILHPTGGVLLGFIMDPRTGLGRFRQFTISNYELMVRLLDACAVSSVEEILEFPDVKERTVLYEEQSALFKNMLLAKTHCYDNVIVTDLRGVETINAGNRFIVYSLFPKGNVSLWIVDGRDKKNVPIAIGYSILNRTCTTHIGNICKRYGGGGHVQVGTCQVDYDDATKIIDSIVEELRVKA
jgi:nanoRNase/pAp phosphatase (c-di-AMP/oligoRNAs hydrolase)